MTKRSSKPNSLSKTGPETTDNSKHVISGKQQDSPLLRKAGSLLTSAGDGGDRSQAHTRRRPTACSRPPTQRGPTQRRAKRRRRSTPRRATTQTSIRRRAWTVGPPAPCEDDPEGPQHRETSTRARAKAARSRAEARGEEPKLCLP